MWNPLTPLMVAITASRTCVLVYAFVIAMAVRPGVTLPSLSNSNTTEVVPSLSVSVSPSLIELPAMQVTVPFPLTVLLSNIEKVVMCDW
jgi:predicted neutral ceramidase superfamily lipid hydrolase